MDSSIAEILRLVVQGAPSAIAVIDEAGEIVLSNVPAQTMGVVLGAHLHQRVRECAQEVASTRRPATVRFQPSLRRASRVSAVEAEIRPLVYRGERYLVVFATDESEHERMESARRDFVANVSHELKTPVGGMALLAEVLLESADDPEAVRHFAEKLLSEAHRMSNLINELIALSKLQGAEKLPDMRPVSVDAIIDDAIQRNKLAAEAANISIERDGPSGVEVMGDYTLLVTAVTNLVVNAINYSPEATPVRVSHEVVGGETVLIKVTDHGIGISEKHQQRVFERFFRVDKARSRQTGGTGLGLAIVKHVAANHGGSIRLWSRLNQGSVFTLELPVHGKAEQ